MSLFLRVCSDLIGYSPHIVFHTADIYDDTRVWWSTLFLFRGKLDLTYCNTKFQTRWCYASTYVIMSSSLVCAFEIMECVTGPDDLDLMTIRQMDRMSHQAKKYLLGMTSSVIIILRLKLEWVMLISVCPFLHVRPIKHWIVCSIRKENVVL